MGRLVAKKWPTWAQLGFQDGAKINEKWGRKSIKFSLPFGIDFLCDFRRFLVEKWRQVGTKIDPKSMYNSKSDLLKKQSFSTGKTILLNVLEVKVGTTNQSKIDQKMSSTSEGLLASIFERFWWIFGPNLGGKIHRTSMSKWMKK